MTPTFFKKIQLFSRYHETNIASILFIGNQDGAQAAASVICVHGEHSGHLRELLEKCTNMLLANSFCVEFSISYRYS